MNGLLQQLSSHGISHDLMIRATFYMVAGATVFFALLVVLARNIFHVAVYLAMALVCVACVYLYLDAEFLAIVQVLIYVGAIVILFIFTVMLTADLDTGSILTRIRHISVPAVVAMTAFFILAHVIKMTTWKTAPPAETPVGLQQLGTSLMTQYALPFEVISLISLAALIGAIVIGKADKK